MKLDEIRVVNIYICHNGDEAISAPEIFFIASHQRCPPSSKPEMHVLTIRKATSIRGNRYSQWQLNTAINLAFHCRYYRQTRLSANLGRLLGKRYFELANNFHQKGLDFSNTTGWRYRAPIVSEALQVNK